MNDWVQALKDYKKMSELGFIDLGRKMARILSKEVKEMTKKEFENALDRSIEAMLDGGQPGIDDILLISKALGGVDLELMSKDERDTYLFGVEAGYKLGIGDSYQAWFWEDEDWEEEDDD